MKQRFVLLVLCLFLLFPLASCDGDSFQANPLGYVFVASHLKTNEHRPIPLAPSHAQAVAHLRPYGLGVPPEAFVTQYGQPLAPSQPPTQLWFKATLDAFPDGSVLIAGFDRSSHDSASRANELSYIAGDKHPTTIAQATTLAESLLPEDATGPQVIHQYDVHTSTCQSFSYTSTTLASLFPAQDFLDAAGKLAKPGTVTLSLFPHQLRGTYNDGEPYEGGLNHTLDQPNIISSFLLTLGTRPYC